nr:early nodulin protein [Tetrastigma hemsleyanum]
MATSRVFLLCFALISLLFACSHAAEYLVGGSVDAWKVPSSHGRLSLSDWAKKQRFRIGDYLIFKYDPKVHSLLELNEEDYQNCTTSRPIKKFTEGYTSYELHRTGRFHFTGGTDEHCFYGQKLFVDVMAAEDLAESELAMTTLAPVPPPEMSKANGLRVGFIGCVTLMMSALFGI